MDKIVRQEFYQESIETWKYQIATQEGRHFTVTYQLLSYGFCREQLFEGNFVIWDREFKIGEAIHPTVYEVIQKRKESLAV